MFEMDRIYINKFNKRVDENNSLVTVLNEMEQQMQKT